MAKKHTAGPWNVHLGMGGQREVDCREEHGYIAHTVYIGCGNTLIGCVEAYQPDHVLKGYPYVSSFDENRANASLIIAAPDLLAELRKAADTFRDTAMYFKSLGKSEGAEAFRIAEQSARATIAKAEGETL